MRNTEKYAGKRVLVVGMARSGIAAAQLLCKAGAHVIINDSKTAEKLGDSLKPLENLPLERRLGCPAMECLDGIDAMVISPVVSFFSWLEDEDFILKSPVRRIHKVKTAKLVKDTYTDEALELMRDSCTTTRDLAIIDLLASSGMRVGEMVMLNREDIDFNERECVVIGKGNKERLVYFDARTKIHLQNYLNERTDANPALFVSLKAPHDRLMIGGVETRLRELGKRLNLPKVHPHKFRRTLATSAIDKGMPIEQVQQLLGHQKIDTTMHYAMVKQQNVKLAHRKYIG